MRGKLSGAVVAAIMCVACGGGGSTREPAVSPQPGPHILRLATPSSGLATAIDATINRVSVQDAHVALQHQPVAGDALAVLFVDEELGDGAPIVPEVCGQLANPVDPAIQVCDASNVCAPLDLHASPTIVCDASFWRDFETLAQLWTNTSFVLHIVESGDYETARLVSRLHREPDKLLAEGHPLDKPEAVIARERFLFLFILSHELAHLREPKVTAHTAAIASGVPVTPSDRRARVACRNFQEFNNAGTTGNLFGMSDRAVDDMADPDTQALIAQTRAIWKSEIEADAQASEAVVAEIEDITKKGAPKPLLISQAIDAILMTDIILWYRREGTVTSTLCSTEHGTDFLLERCACQNTANRRHLGALLDELHPPITLRAQIVGNALLTPLQPEFASLPQPVQDYFTMQASLLITLQNIPYEIAAQNCVKDLRTTGTIMPIVDIALAFKGGLDSVELLVPNCEKLK
jgi:hypothetical protein